MTQPIPAGFHTLTPHLVCDGAAKAIDFYKEAFGAEEIARAPAPGSDKLIHALIRIGDSLVMLVDDFPEFTGGKASHPHALGGSPVSLHLYTTDVDAAMDRAVKAGCTLTMPVMDQFWDEIKTHPNVPYIPFGAGGFLTIPEMYR